jgi:hypothetical protein
MADETSTFAVALEDGTSDVARDAASALEELKSALVGDMAALSEMNKALRNLKSAGLQGTDQFKRLTDQVKAQKAQIGATQQSVLKLGGGFKKAKPPVDDFADFKNVLGQLGGPLNGLLGKLGGLKGVLGVGVLAAGALAFAAGLTAVAAAALMATAALLKYGIAAGDARRNERLALEGLTKVRNWYGIAAGKATDLQAAIDKVSDSSSLGREKINELAAGLYRSNLRGAALEQALEGVATATDVAGEAQGEFYRAMFMGAGRYGGSTKKVLDDVRARFGGIAKMKSLSLDSQTRKMRENFARIFAGLNVDKFLGGLKLVTDLFSQTTSTGKALKVIVETLFQPMIDFIGNQGILVKRFFQGLVIGALLLAIGVLKVRKVLKEAFGDTEILKGIDLQKTAVLLGAAALGALVGALVGLAAALALVAAPFVLAAAQMYGWYRAVVGVYDLIAGIDFAEVGTNLINGFINGIKSGVARAVSAVRELGDKALKALKEKLQIFSPSRAFAKLGVQIPRGVAVGVRAGTGEAAGAVRQMAARTEGEYEPGTEGGGASGGRAAAPAGAPSLSVVIQQLVLQAASGEPKAHQEAIEDGLGRVLERVLAQLGGRPATA